MQYFLELRCLIFHSLTFKELNTNLYQLPLGETLITGWKKKLRREKPLADETLETYQKNCPLLALFSRWSARVLRKLTRTFRSQKL